MLKNLLAVVFCALPQQAFPDFDDGWTVHDRQTKSVTDGEEGERLAPKATKIGSTRPAKSYRIVLARPPNYDIYDRAVTSNLSAACDVVSASFFGSTLDNLETDGSV